MSKLEDIDLINYVINKGATLKEAADYFDVSLSTVKKKMSKIKSDLKEESDIYINLTDVSSVNERQGKISGGKAHMGLKYDTFSKEEVVEIAMNMIADNLSIDEAAVKYNIPPSTLYDRLTTLNCSEYKNIYNDLLYIFEIHRKSTGITKDRKLYIEQLMMKYKLQLDERNNTKK